jgi:hypothetical protein
MATHIRHDHDELLTSLLGGKLPRNLSWNAVVDLIGKIGEVQEHGNDEFAFVVGNQRGIFKRPSSHDLEVDEISKLRSFLKAANVSVKQPREYEPGRMVVVIDHHAAHIYQDLGGSMPQNEATVKPYDPFGFQHHLVHRKEAHYIGERVPEESSFYEEIAVKVAHASAIVLIGHGKGKSSAVDVLRDYLKTHHPETFDRIIATENADLSALTEAEIEAIAKKHLRAASEPIPD